ncbi:uncharacterized protein [Porites lutea]|uniref:uncharacterized protein n=1 Tax=Porites lutea TaxID=51062 RepID=UPI003CC5A57E
MYVIDDLGYEAVVGRDFLEEKGAVIDFRDRTVQLTDSTPLECLPATQVVRAVTSYVKPPQAETILLAKMEQETIIEGTGLIEPSPQRVQPDPQRVSVVKEFPVPCNVKQVRSFLGLRNYYSKFVRGFAKIAEPLNNLTRKSTPFVWDENCQAAFDTLKQALTEAPILDYPDFTLPLDLYVDASDEGIGMVLGQDKKEKSE